MSGLVKAKKYDWKDSNLALFGSDTEKQVKKESAESEPAWQGTGQKVGLRIWRIVKFKVVKWPEVEHGKFYKGDSYIILNTYKPSPDSEELAYDVHFWIGEESTQDEYGTAAYKTVELDTFLDDKAVQHREVGQHESDLFKSYFPRMEIMKGGAETGFRHVEPEKYQPRLLHFHGAGSKITVNEVPRSKDRLKSDDVFILDLGLDLYQWNGNTCNKDEKFKAAQFMQNLRSERGGKPERTVLEEDDVYSGHAFLDALTEDDDDDDEDETDDAPVKSLYRVSDESGSMEVTEVEPVYSESELDSNEVYVLDNGKAAFVWVGHGASPNESKNGMTYAHNILMNSGHPLVPVSVVKQGQTSRDFDSAIAA